ncbi:hypothetical protein [Candidatus Nitrospira bockiana]
MAPESFLVGALTDLISDLNRRRVQYALAGGWAFSALVEPRATTDIDLLILIEQPSREAIGDLLTPVFPSLIVHATPMIFGDISIWRTVGIRQDMEVIVDLLLADSEFLRHVLARRHRVPFGALQVPMVTLEDLILLKHVAGRLQDLADLAKIREREAELQVDWSYVEQWKAKLGL